jgi:DNA-directed RNA polymerase subunit RPC12/RpoP
MSDPHEEWRCPNCGSRSDEHTVERDGPESLDVVVCRRCGTKWAPRPAVTPPVEKR